MLKIGKCTQRNCQTLGVQVSCCGCRCICLLEMASSDNGKRTVRMCWDLSWFVQHKLCPQCRNRQSPDYFRGSNGTDEARSDRTDSTRPIQRVFQLFQLEIRDGQVADFLEEMANYLESHLAALDEVSHFLSNETTKDVVSYFFFCMNQKAVKINPSNASHCEWLQYRKLMPSAFVFGRADQTSTNIRVVSEARSNWELSTRTSAPEFLKT